MDLAVPGSKSATLRALVAAALASGRSRLGRALVCEDTQALATSLGELGAAVVPGDAWEVSGTGGAVAAGPCALVAGESGAALRFLLALAATGDGDYRIGVRGRLGARPTGELTAALVRLGAEVDRVAGGYRVSSRRPRGGSLALGRVGSSQTLSALLLAGPLLPEGIEIRFEEPVPSGGYLELTCEWMRRFGVPVTREAGRLKVPPGSCYRPLEVVIEGDWSSAAYLLAGAALAGRRLRLSGLDLGSRQPDRAVISLLRQAGVSIDDAGPDLLAWGRAVHPIDADFDPCPDLAPAIAALAAAIAGTSVLRGVGRLRDKESDRLAAMVEGLVKAGIDSEVAGDVLRVHGGGRLRPVLVDGCRDHRVVMSFALLSLVEPGLAVGDHGAVAKSYPAFFDDLDRLRNIG